MRTTLNIPGELLEEARSLLQFQSKTDTVIVALKELIRRKKIEQLKELAGKVEIDLDIDSSRRRPSAKKKR